MENPGARSVARDEVGNATISTVHLVLNHQYGAGPPLIFETMVFGGDHDLYQLRYPTEQLALEGHQQVVAWLRGQGSEP